MVTLPDLSNKLPMLSIAHNPGGQMPVIINLYPDWEKTGECHISYVELSELIELARLLNFIVDAVADEVYVAQIMVMKRRTAGEEDIPF